MGSTLTFKHNLILRQVLHDARDDVGPPARDVLGDALALDHEPLSSGIQHPLAQVDQLTRVAGADGFKLAGGGV